jgi:hypothetical protein
MPISEQHTEISASSFSTASLAWKDHSPQFWNRQCKNSRVKPIKCTYWHTVRILYNYISICFSSEFDHLLVYNVNGNLCRWTLKKKLFCYRAFVSRVQLIKNWIYQRKFTTTHTHYCLFVLRDKSPVPLSLFNSGFVQSISHLVTIYSKCPLKYIRSMA